MWPLRKKKADKVLLSIIVVAYNMQRELPRTLHSLTTAYQLDSSTISYEVIVVDNGSSPAFGNDNVTCYGEHFHYLYIENASPSPAAALNQGAALAKGKFLCFMIDGARILSPGVLSLAAQALTSLVNPVIAVMGFHLGSKLQNQSMLEGYNQQVEDKLLADAAWEEDGYRLFDISVFAGSCRGGWFKPISESNALFMSAKHFHAIGRVDERFDEPGGGFVNLDLFKRALLQNSPHYVLLLGEGTFHQVHGGVATNAGEAAKQRGTLWREKYKQLRGEAYAPVKKTPLLIGSVHPAVKQSLIYSSSKI